LQKYSKMFLRFSALFAIVGGILGSHMAGSGDYAFQSVHAHVLVVGWLTLFAWAVFYKVFTPTKSIVAISHVWTGIIGTFGLTIGMWLFYVNPFNLNDVVTTIFFIVGGTILLISFILFFILTFMRTEAEK